MAGRYRRCGCSGLYIGAQEAFWYANNRRENPPVFFTLALLHRFSWIFHKKWKRPKLLPPKKDQPAEAAPDGYTTSAVIAPKALNVGGVATGKALWIYEETYIRRAADRHCSWLMSSPLLWWCPSQNLVDSMTTCGNLQSSIYTFLKKEKKKLREIPRLPRRLPRDSHSQFFISNFDVAAIPSGILFNNKK